MCMPSVLIGGQAQYQLLTTALSMRMIDRGYVFIPYDTLLYSLPYKDTNYYVLGNDTNLRKAFDGVVTITMDSGQQSFYEAFRDAQKNYEIRSSTPPEEVRLFSKSWLKMLTNLEEDEGSSRNLWILIMSYLSPLLGFSILWHHLQHDVFHSNGYRAGTRQRRPLGNWSYVGQQWGRLWIWRLQPALEGWQKRWRHAGSLCSAGLQWHWQHSVLHSCSGCSLYRW